jgi:ketopantoate reductase
VRYSRACACTTQAPVVSSSVNGSIQRIAVVGSGAVGGYYGAKLARHFDVSFLMRRDLKSVRENGLRIESVDGDFTLDRSSVRRNSVGA